MLEVNLRELMNDVDLSEPSYMDKVLECVEELRLQDENFMDNLVSKLDTMIITWEQPWYQQSHCLTRRLQDTEVPRDNAVTYRTGRCTKEESDRIEKNWRKFREKYDVSDTPICLARYRSRTRGRMPKTPQERVRHFVISFLARGVQRTLSQVYGQFVSMYAYVQSGPYTPLEERIIQICLDHNPEKAGPFLSYLLSRQPRQIYNRLHSRDECDAKKDVKICRKWTLERASQVVNMLMEATGLQLSELKNRDIGIDVWRKVEIEMNHPMQYIKCFWFKKLHVQLFIEEDLTMSRIRRRIFKRLRFYPYKVWTDIRWKELVKEFPDGCTPLFIYTVAIKTFRHYEQYRKEPLDEVIEYALQLIPRRNWRIRRLTLDDTGHLQPLRE